jgi:hypothetical protein
MQDFDFEEWKISSQPTGTVTADCPVCGHWCEADTDGDWPTVEQLRVAAQEHWVQKHGRNKNKEV